MPSTVHLPMLAVRIHALVRLVFGHFHLSHDYEDSITFPGEAFLARLELCSARGLSDLPLQAATGAATASLRRQE